MAVDYVLALWCVEQALYLEHFLLACALVLVFAQIYVTNLLIINFILTLTSVISDLFGKPTLMIPFPGNNPIQLIGTKLLFPLLSLFA